ncbi:MAG: hypothetical protein HPY83_18140, partial [Anaerolineae bacterium]|nr:hypothetical protein [Anaerolineae bacterium]
MPALPAGLPLPALTRLQRLVSNRWVRLVFLALSLTFMVFVLRSYWVDMLLLSYRPSLSPAWLAVSFLGVLPALLLEVMLWRALLAGLGHRLSPRRSAGLWFLSNLARYIPGNVWQFAGMMELGATSGVPRAATMASIVLHQIGSNLAGLLIGAPLLANALGASLEARVALSLATAAALSASLSPMAVARLNRLLARVTRAGDAARVHLSSGRLILVLAGYCLYWLWVGATFWALGRGLGAQPGSLFAWASAFSASYVAGYLSLL